MKNPQLMSHSVVKTECFPPMIRNKTRMSMLTTFIQHSIGSPSHNRQEKGRKGIQIDKEEVMHSLFADDIILYIKHPQDATQNYYNGWMNSVKLQDTKSICRNLMHCYLLISSREIKKTAPFTIVPKTTRKKDSPRKKLNQGVERAVL